MISADAHKDECRAGQERQYATLPPADSGQVNGVMPQQPGQQKGARCGEANECDVGGEKTRYRASTRRGEIRAPNERRAHAKRNSEWY